MGPKIQNNVSDLDTVQFHGPDAKLPELDLSNPEAMAVASSYAGLLSIQKNLVQAQTEAEMIPDHEITDPQQTRVADTRAFEGGVSSSEAPRRINITFYPDDADPKVSVKVFSAGSNSQELVNDQAQAALNKFGAAA